MLLPFALAATACILGCKDSSKATAFSVGFTSSEMNHYAAMQAKSNWCWAACTQMVLSTKGIELPQEEVVRRSFGSEIDAPASVLVIAANLEGWEIQRGKRRLRVQALGGLGPPTHDFLIAELRRKSPVIVCIGPETGEVGHAVVVSAVVGVKENGVEHVKSVMIRDPSPLIGAANQKRKLTVEELARTEAYLVVREAPFKQ